MQALRRLLGLAPPQSVVQSDDDIYPLHLLDDTETYRSIVVTCTLRFNDVLDPEKLESSLSSLLEIGDWRKLGGRLRLKHDGGLEIYVPRPFTAERPAVSCSRQEFDLSIDEHPLAKRLPTATAEPSVQSAPEDFAIFASRPGAPATIWDYIKHSTSMLSLHTTTFSDATLVGLSWPHVLMDAIGQQSLLRSWSLVLAEKDSLLPPLLGAREDLLSAAAEDPCESPESYQMGQQKLGGWGMLSFGLRLGWDIFRNPTVHTRTIFLPRAAMTRLKQQAEQDLAAQSGGADKTFISEGDVLTGWATRAVAQALPTPRPVTLLQVMNARFRVEKLMHTTGDFVQNMALPCFNFLSAEAAVSPVGQIAAENRRQIREQSTEAQMLAFVRDLRAQASGGPLPPILCGPTDALLLPFTNWTRAEIFQAIDFAPAVVRSGSADESRSNPPGSTTYFHSSPMQHSSVTRNVFIVYGKDHQGNYWLQGFFAAHMWPMIEAALKEI